MRARNRDNCSAESLAELPIFYHMPSGNARSGITKEVRTSFRRLCRRTLAVRGRPLFTSPSNVTFFTFSNYRRLTLLERCYRRHSVPHVVLAREVKRWTWMAKIIPLLHHLDHASVTTEYLVATDARDILMVNDPSTLDDRFASANCDLLFCNTCCNWPRLPKCAQFEIDTYISCPRHAHLSAGGYVGRWQVVRRYLKEIVDRHASREPGFVFNGGFDDQATWRYLHQRDYPKIKVDVLGRVFKRFDIYRNLHYVHSPGY